MRHQKRFFEALLTGIVTTIVAIGCSADPTPPNEPTDETKSALECGGLGAPCEISGDCCDRDCSLEGVCGHPSGGECKGRGARCAMDGDCCSDDCHYPPSSSIGHCR
jgi:hypothetical protein